jgi:hypothetical protein
MIALGSKQTLALKATCLLSAILGFATPLMNFVSYQEAGAFSYSVSAYLTKVCNRPLTANGAYVNGNDVCTNYGGDAPDKQKAAIAFCAIALIISFIQCVLHFTAKLPNHALLGKLSLAAAFAFLISFSLIANNKGLATTGFGGGDNEINGPGFASLIIGWLASAGLFVVVRKQQRAAPAGAGGAVKLEESSSPFLLGAAKTPLLSAAADIASTAAPLLEPSPSAGAVAVAGAAAVGIVALASEFPVVGTIVGVARKLKGCYDTSQHADAACRAMAKWAADVESVVTKMPRGSLEGAAAKSAETMLRGGMQVTKVSRKGKEQGRIIKLGYSDGGLTLECGPTKAFLLRQLEGADEEDSAAERGALLSLSFGAEGERLQLLLPTTVQRAELRRALLALKTRELRSEEVDNDVVMQKLLQLLQEMLTAVERRAAQGTIMKFASSAACKAQQNAAQEELARLLPLLQLGAQAEALQHQMAMMQAVLEVKGATDEILAGQAKLLAKDQLRSAKDERQYARDATFRKYSVARDAVQLHTDAVLGVGGSATVYKATYQHKLVAAKVVSLVALTLNEQAKVAESMHRELEMMANLNSTFIVRVLGICEDPADRQLIMIMQLAEGGSLRQKLDGCTAPLATADVIKMMLDAAIGMEYLHSKMILHRDVKSLNLLLDAQGCVLVSDFGISKSLNAATAQTGNNAKGSAPWMSPEALAAEPATEPRDVYAFGVVMWEIMSLQKPWEDMQLPQIVHAVCVKPSPENRPPLDAIDASYPAPLLALMQACWAQDPAARPSFTEIIRRLEALMS